MEVSLVTGGCSNVGITYTEFCWVGLAIFGVRLGQACAQLTHAWVKFSRVAQRRFFNSAICVSSPELSPNPPGEAENGSDCTWVRLYVGRIVTGNV